MPKFEPDGSISIILPHLVHKPVEIEFVETGTIKQAMAYDLGRVHTQVKNEQEILHAQTELQKFQRLIKERIYEVQNKPSPTIPEETQQKIDKVLSVIDSLSDKPGIARFGKFCANERQLLDRCYLANSRDVIQCHDYAVQFSQCVYKDDYKHQQEQLQKQQQQQQQQQQH